jgi:hypothetical protein
VIGESEDAIDYKIHKRELLIGKAARMGLTYPQKPSHYNYANAALTVE